jgi:hypothetical protein
MKSVFYLGGGIVIGLAVLVMAPAFDHASVATTHLELEMASMVTAGESLEIEVIADPGAAVDLYVIDSYGTSHRRLRIEDRPRRVAATATTAGRLDVVAISGDLDATASALVRPASAGPTPSPLVGARSIVADGVDRAMVVVIPEDEYGNPTGGAASVTAVHPDGTRVILDTAATASLRWTWVSSLTTAGTAQVAVDHAGSRGPTRTLVEIPAAPVQFVVEAVTQLRPADGHTLVEVTTTPLADRFGNRVVDGTAALVAARFDDGAETFQTAMVVGGVVRALIEAPDQPGVVDVRISVNGVTGSELALDFDSPLFDPADAEPRPLRLIPLGGGA